MSDALPSVPGAGPLIERAAALTPHRWLLRHGDIVRGLSRAVADLEERMWDSDAAGLRRVADQLGDLAFLLHGAATEFEPLAAVYPDTGDAP